MDQLKVSPLLTLQKLGLTISIGEATAERIWANLLILDGLFRQGEFGEYSARQRSQEYLRRAYHAIAEPLVDAETADVVVERIIPAMATAFLKRIGERFIPEDLHDSGIPYEIVLDGPIKEWKGKLILKRLEAGVNATPESPRERRKQVQETQAELISRRRKLLADYKSATGTLSNYGIYNARNSGIYKPQFYGWLNGKLSSESATCEAFERFLREKKQPIPRRPHE